MARYARVAAAAGGVVFTFSTTDADNNGTGAGRGLLPSLYFVTPEDLARFDTVLM